MRDHMSVRSWLIDRPTARNRHLTERDMIRIAGAGSDASTAEGV